MSDEFANEFNIQHMLLDFDVDHILTANTIDDGHWFSDNQMSLKVLLFVCI